MKRQRPWFVLAAGCLACAGCQTEVYNPWQFAEPPARASDEGAMAESGRPVVVVAEFGNPAAPQISWTNVGQGMSEALRRALRNDGHFDVRSAQRHDRVVDEAKGRKGAAPAPAPAPSETVPPDSDFVVMGQVTDFHHTAALPKEVRRWGLFGRRSEAVVAIEWRVIDVRSKQVIAADHTYGTCDASRKKSVNEIYAGLDFSAYLFWNSPLGKAGHLAVDKMVKKMRKLLPSYIGDPTIARRTSEREVELTGGWTWGLVEGQEYYVSLPDATGVSGAPVYDSDTHRPLMVRIGSVKKTSCRAWLIGKPPEGVDLRGAILSREPPPPADEAGRKALVGIDGE